MSAPDVPGCPGCGSVRNGDYFGCGNHRDYRLRSDECYTRELQQLRARLAAAEAALAKQCFYASPKQFSRSGYSLDVGPETAFTEIDYRDVSLYPTAEEAVAAKIAEYQRGSPRQPVTDA